MSPTRTITFDRPIHQDVTVAVAPLDVFTGRIVRADVTATVDALANRPVRNLGGLLVFTDLPAQTSYTIRVTAKGYFDPEPRTFVPPDPQDPESPRKRRLVVALRRRPSGSVVDEATVVSGVLQRGGEPVAGTDVSAQEVMIEALGSPFTTSTDDRGAFSVYLRLTPIADAGADKNVVPVSFTFGSGAASRQFVRDVEEGALHGFVQPVDLDESDVDIPKLAPAART